MNPRKEVIGNATLYLGDCLEILPTIGKVDAVITDPPYGIAYKHGGGGKGKHTRRNTKPIAGDSQPFDPSPWLAFDNVILWGADHFYPRLPDSGRFLAWNKLGDMEPFDKFCDVEFAWKWKGIASEKAGEDPQRYHPSQKPLSLMRWCIAESRAADLILDPYMGSGTTGVASVQSRRSFIGIELDVDYFDIACERIENAQRQSSLLDGYDTVTRDYEQGSLLA